MGIGCLTKRVYDSLRGGFSLLSITFAHFLGKQRKVWRCLKMLGYVSGSVFVWLWSSSASVNLHGLDPI